ncbi:MAG: hypothetical protein PF961_05520 [Planctomycetota bacterium]|nr:hypothetical protein [Planctomycetota bacterium]
MRVPAAATRARHRFAGGLSCYVRFRPERAGETVVALRMKDERREVWDESWLATNMRMSVAEEVPQLIEMSVVTAPFAVDVSWSQPGADRLVLHNTVELEVDGQLVASAPFDVVFQRVASGDIAADGASG